MESPKNVLPRIAQRPAGTRTASSMPSARLGRQSRFERWLIGRLDRLDDRMRRRRERLAVRWDQLNREDRHAGLIIRFQRRRYLFTDRVERLAALLLIRWYRFIFHVLNRWELLAIWFLVLRHRLRHPLGGAPDRIIDLRAERSRRHPASRGGALVAAGLSVALAVTVIALLPLGRDAPDAPVRPETSLTDRSPAPELSIAPAPDRETIPSPDAPLGLATYTNEQAGYLFSYPDDWDVSTSGDSTIISDPDGQVVISFDSAAPGSLQQASGRALMQLSETYSAPETIATEVDRTPQGYRSISVGGTARDASGAPIRFLVITIGGADQNWALSVRFPDNPDPRDLDAVLEVVGSYRIAPAA